eukprot:gene8217-biopygen743
MDTILQDGGTVAQNPESEIHFVRVTRMGRNATEQQIVQAGAKAPHKAAAQGGTLWTQPPSNPPGAAEIWPWQTTAAASRRRCHLAAVALGEGKVIAGGANSVAGGAGDCGGADCDRQRRRRRRRRRPRPDSKVPAQQAARAAARQRASAKSAGRRRGTSDARARQITAQLEPVPSQMETTTPSHANTDLARNVPDESAPEKNRCQSTVCTVEYPPINRLLPPSEESPASNSGNCTHAHPPPRMHAARGEGTGHAGRVGVGRDVIGARVRRGCRQRHAGRDEPPAAWVPARLGTARPARSAGPRDRRPPRPRQPDVAVSHARLELMRRSCLRTCNTAPDVDKAKPGAEGMLTLHASPRRWVVHGHDENPCGDVGERNEKEEIFLPGHVRPGVADDVEAKVVQRLPDAADTVPESAARYAQHVLDQKEIARVLHTRIQASAPATGSATEAPRKRHGSRRSRMPRMQLDYYILLYISVRCGRKTDVRTSVITSVRTLVRLETSDTEAPRKRHGRGADPHRALLPHAYRSVHVEVA